MIIGIHPNKDAIQQQFNDALFTDDELQEWESGKEFPDPFAQVVSMELIS